MPISPVESQTEARPSAACGRVLASPPSCRSRDQGQQGRADDPERDNNGADHVVFFEEVAVYGAEHDRQDNCERCRERRLAVSAPPNAVITGPTINVRREDRVALRHEVGEGHDRNRDQPRENPAAGVQRLRLRHSGTLTVRCCKSVRLNHVSPRYGFSVSSVSLPANTSAAGAARRFVRDALSGAGLRDEAVSDVELLVSELVTNAVIHARSELLE